MSSLWSVLSWLAALPILVLLVLFCIECVAALLPAPSVRCDGEGTRAGVAVLVPAHNESSVIGSTLDSLRPQLAPGDRLVVVADNCSDDTAAIAQAHGATVLQRRDTERTGKGYALDWGIRHLQSHPPQVVVVVDADTAAHAGAISALAGLAQAAQEPVQAAYLLEAPPGARAYHRITAFAVLVKNFVRPAGLARLGLPCLLTGSGMAFPWSVIHPIELASGHLTEDLMLTSQLALRGCVARFCAEARISGMLPEGAAPMRSQRTRWEHGHLQTLASEVPRLVASSLRQHRLDVLALALEMAVPPLSLLTLLWSGSLGAVTLTGLGGASATPALLLTAGAAMAFSAVLAVWARFGRAILPIHSVLAIPGYVLAKVPLYLGYVLRRQTKWERTARTSDSWPGVRPGHDHARRGGGPGWR